MGEFQLFVLRTVSIEKFIAKWFLGRDVFEELSEREFEFAKQRG